MACGMDHPKVTVHVGDGFKFLADYKNAFDVIITDSSDPDGPAEALFEKSYFQLLHDALRPGGVITTQGCMFPRIDSKLSQATCLGFLFCAIGPTDNISAHLEFPLVPDKRSRCQVDSFKCLEGSM